MINLVKYINDILDNNRCNNCNVIFENGKFIIEVEIDCSNEFSEVFQFITIERLKKVLNMYFTKDTYKIKKKFINRQKVEQFLNI